ncbi:hypothetical protein J6590_044857 [Homalodisca vitripennis]|nr:hypothetical protein J6590_044857 [Homalodisca vitripennis]
MHLRGRSSKTHRLAYQQIYRNLNPEAKSFAFSLKWGEIRPPNSYPWLYVCSQQQPITDLFKEGATRTSYPGCYAEGRSES